MVKGAVGDAFYALDWITARHVHEYFDVGGRPLGEGRAAAFDKIQTELQLCPYVGGRYHHGKPMNVTALRQMPPWRDLLITLAWLSQRRQVRRRTKIATYDDLAQVTASGIFLVDFLALRRRHPLRSGEIPLLISGLYKLCLGFQLAYLPERYADHSMSSRLPDSAGFYAYLEESELLIGEAEVCAGSPAMITQAYEAVIGGEEVRPEDLPRSFAKLEIDWDQFDVFTESAANIWQDLVLYVMQAPGFVPELADPRLPADLRDRLNICIQRHSVELLAEQKGLVVDIARGALLYSDGPATTWQPQAVPSANSRPSGLAAAILTWLHAVAGQEMQSFEPMVASELETRLVSYDLYEAAVLADVNRNLGALMRALGKDEAGSTLTPPVLSHICGRTLRDWDVAPS
jgi:hypothetical protein